MTHVSRIFALPFLLVCAGCSGWQSALDPHGFPALTLNALIWFIVVVCTAVWLLVMLVLAHALWRWRPERAEPFAIDAGIEHRMTIVVTGAIVLTALIVTSFCIASFLTTRALVNADRDALVIRVRGYQWWWEITYLHHSPDQVFTTANEIHIPVGRPVRVELAAADVIHSFWVPSLAGKQDLIPGRANAIMFSAERAGVYRGQCAEFCGLQHAHMALLVIAEEPAQFEMWQETQLATSSAPVDEEQRHGQQVFLAKACAACHAVRGTAAAGTLGPDLTHIGSRRTIAAGVFENTRGSLAAWIADPQTIKPGNNMPMIPLTPDELKAVSAYMVSLK